MQITRTMDWKMAIHATVVTMPIDLSQLCHMSVPCHAVVTKTKPAEVHIA